MLRAMDGLSDVSISFISSKMWKPGLWRLGGERVAGPRDGVSQNGGECKLRAGMTYKSALCSSSISVCVQSS